MLGLDVGRDEDAQPVDRIGQHRAHRGVEAFDVRHRSGCCACGTAPAAPPTGSRRCRRCRCRPRIAGCAAVASARRGAGGCAGGRRRASARGRRHRDPSRPIRGSRPWSRARRGRACRASRGRRSAGPSPSSSRRRRPVRARTRSRGGREPEAAGEHRVGGQHTLAGAVALERHEQELAAPAWQRRGSRPRRASSSSGVARTRIGVGAVASRTVAPGHPSPELLGHDREIGQLRHAGGSSLARMVCSPGRVADNPISARERVVPIG